MRGCGGWVGGRVGVRRGKGSMFLAFFWGGGAVWSG